MADGFALRTVRAMSEHTKPQIVVAGAGIAALEFVLALRAHAGERTDVVVVAPNRELLLRPTLIAQPLGLMPAPRLTLDSIAADVGFRIVPGSIKTVDAQQREVVLRAGGTVAYDTLVLAPGARRLPAFDHAIHIGDEAGTRALQTLRDEIAAGDVRTVAFIAPTLTGWLLPLYEAALLTARLGAVVSLVTAEERPLALFGDAASAAVDRELRAAGVSFHGGHQPNVFGGAVTAGGLRIEADRVVSLPLVRGPHIPGVPQTGVYGLIGVDEFGRIAGLADAYAIGDATDFPIKQGGLACQQANVAALHIAAHHGAPVQPEPFRPSLRAVLLTGREPLMLGAGDEPATGKVPGRYLGPYLAAAAAPA
jgi:sulfide:quinone oxidoreductase